MAVTNVTGPRKGSRYHRMDDIPKDTFTPRAYQIELLESAIKQNTILCLSCPQSKVFLSLMVAKQMASLTRLTLANGGKRTVYLTDSDEDMEMVYQTLPHHTDVPVGKVTSTQEEQDCTIYGSTGDRLVTSWDELIEVCSIIVCRGYCFLDALLKKAIHLEAVNLLIFDDCHKCVEIDAHPYIDIVSNIVQYSGNKQSKPHILGVTASIAGTDCTDPKHLQHTIESMEKSLCSRAETSMLILSERFGSRPKESVIKCHALTEKQSLLYDVLEDILLDSLEFLQDCNIAIDDSVDNRSPLETPMTVITECLNILSVLGSWCTSSVADVFIMQIDKIIKCEKNDVHKKFLRYVNTTLRMLVKSFEKHYTPDYDVDQLLEYTTSKVKEMVDVLRNYKPEIDFMIINNDEPFDNDGDFSDMSDEEEEFMMSGSDGDDENGGTGQFSNRPLHIAIKRTPDGGVERITNYSEEDDKNLCGIVFVENHYIAFGLNKIIEEICSWDENLCFVKNCHIMGHSLKGGNSKSKRNKSYKKQEETLRKFRLQEKNLVIATHELEEGIDLPKCNLVVRFDPPKDYRSYTLSKGRARARDASFVILLDEDNSTFFQSNLQIFKGIEQVLLGNHRNENPALPEVSLGGNEDNCSIPPYSSTYAEITMDGAIALINRYCAKLPSDAFTHLTPQCRIEIVPGDPPAYIAILRLPINSPIKAELKGPKMMSVKLAEKAVALKMCEMLHKKGELDDNLVPVGKEMFLYEEEEEWADEEDGAGQARPGSTKRKQYYVKKVADALVQSQVSTDHPCFLYLLNLRLTGKITDEQNTRGRTIYAPEDTPQTLGLLLSKKIPQMPSFPIYTRSGEVTASIDLLKNDAKYTNEELTQLQNYHHAVFSGVLNLEKEPMEFSMEKAESGFMVVPLNGKGSLDIDWPFVHKVVDFMKMEKRRNIGNPANMDLFTFSTEKFEDAVVMPSYRNIDQPQHFYVAEIRNDLNPCSPFPSPDLYKTFQDYYTTKYGLAITNTTQPLLDVDHTSIRLNLLTPRYMNQKGVALPTSSAETKKARRENLQQKQILIPELCDVHVFPASLWRKTVCLPAILYRLNCLLLSEELRKKISKETTIGIANLPEDFQFPKLDFGFDTSPENLKEAEPKNDEQIGKDVAVLSNGDNSDERDTVGSCVKLNKLDRAVNENGSLQNGGDVNGSIDSPVSTIILNGSQGSPGTEEIMKTTVNENIVNGEKVDRTIHSPTSTNHRSESSPVPVSNGMINGHADSVLDSSSVVSNQNGACESDKDFSPKTFANGQQKTSSSTPVSNSLSQSDAAISSHDNLSPSTHEPFNAQSPLISNDGSVSTSVDEYNGNNGTSEITCKTSSAHHIPMQSSVNVSNNKHDEELKSSTNKQVLFTANSTTQSFSPISIFLSSSSSSSCVTPSTSCNMPSGHFVAADVTPTQCCNRSKSKSEENQNGTIASKYAKSSHFISSSTAAAEMTSDHCKFENYENTNTIDNAIPLTLENESSVRNDVIYSSNGCDYKSHSTPTSALTTPLNPSNYVVSDANSDKETKMSNGRYSWNEVENNNAVSRSLEQSSAERMRALLNEKNKVCNGVKAAGLKESKCTMDYANKTSSQPGHVSSPPRPPPSSSSPAIVMNSLSADLNDIHINLVLPVPESSHAFQSDNFGWNQTPQNNASNQFNHSNGNIFANSHSSDSFCENIKEPDTSTINDDDVITFSFTTNDPPPGAKKDLVINQWDSKQKEKESKSDTISEDKGPRDSLSSSVDKLPSVKHQNISNAKQDAKNSSNTPFTIDVWKSNSEKVEDKKTNSQQLYRKLVKVPSKIFHSSSVISLDEDRDLKTFAGPSPCLILQALTMSNANDFFSLERLETIGDSFLKYAITVYLYCSYPGIHEGKLSFLRSKQVSNYNLYRLGRRKGLAEYMVSTKFEPYENWLPPGFIINGERRRGPVPKVIIVPPLKNNSASNVSLDETAETARKDEAIQFSKELELLQYSQEVDQKKDMEDPGITAVPFCLPCHHGLPDKSIADCVESLIGCYLTTCGRKAALMFMSWLGLKVLPKKTPLGRGHEAIKEPKMSKSDWLQMSEQEFDELQCPPSPMFSSTPEAKAQLNQLLEGFDSLEEKICYKFNDRSYLLQAFTHASYHYNTITDCYQRIEFLGDAILDYVITRHLYEDSQKYSPGILTDLRSALVNNNIFAALAVKWGFHCYFKAISPSLFSVIDKFVTRQKEKNYDDIDVDEEYRELNLEEGETDDNNEEDEEEEQVEMEIPKALGDIFESVAGAIYLDSGMSLDTVWRVYYRMMKPYIDKYLKSIPKSPVRELLEREPETAKFERPQRTMNGKVRVTVNVVGKGVFSGVGRNYRIAKSAAAKKALRSLRAVATT